METVPLFSTPVHVTSIKISDELKNIVKSYEYERMPNHTGWYTKNKYILNDPAFSDLKKELLDKFNNFVYNTLNVQPNINFKLLTSWAVKMSPKDWGQRHSHPNSMLSGVVYIETDQESGSIVFHRDNSQKTIFPDVLSIEFTQWNPLNSRAWSYKPNVGDILFFPSFLEHSMETNNSTIDRYSLAFNFFPVGTFGKNECELTLQ